jgi:predicted methyltransferase
MKTCKICYISKNTSEFNKSNQNKDGLYSYCKPCTKLRIKRYHEDTKDRKVERELIWKKLNPEKVKAISKRQTLNGYNLSEEEYYKLVALQENQCKICGIHRSNLKIDLAIDHCHNTGRIRGLLCNKCNLGLGYFRENVEYLSNAIHYLRDT